MDEKDSKKEPSQPLTAEGRAQVKDEDGGALQPHQSPFFGMTMHILGLKEEKRQREEERQARDAQRKRDLSGIKFSIETITPEDAKRYLTNITAAKIDRDGEPRVGDKAALARYTQQMKEGLWILNGEPIIFDQRGDVLDGVSRLLACQAANTPFKTVVARGVNPDVLHTIGAHSRRTYAQILASRNEVKDAKAKNAKLNEGRLLQNLIRLIRFTRKELGYTNRRVSWIDLDRTYEAIKKDLIAADIWASDPSRENISQHSLPLLALLAIMSGETRALEVLTTNVDQISDDTEKRVVNRMLNKIRSRRSNENTDDVKKMIFELAVAIRALNDLVAGNDSGPYDVVFRQGYGETTASGLRKVHSFIEFYSEDKTAPSDSEQKEILEKLPKNSGIPEFFTWPGCPAALDDGGTTPSGWVDAHLSEMLKKAAKEGGEPQIEFMEISPDTAEDWLERYNIGNRKVQPNQVRLIANDIREDRWMINAVPICFANDPTQGEARLLNGQHRLKAVVAAGKSIDVAVATGIHPNSFTTYDQQARHPVQTRIKLLDGRVNATVAKYFLYEATSGMLSEDGSMLAGLNVLEPPIALFSEEISRHSETKKAIDLMTRTFPEATPTEAQVKEFVEEHEEELIDLYGLARKFSDPQKKKGEPTPPPRCSPRQCAPESVSTWLMFRARRENKSIADDFIDYYVWRLNIDRYTNEGRDDFLRSKHDREKLHALVEKKQEIPPNVTLLADLHGHVKSRDEMNTASVIKSLYRIWRTYLANRLGLTIPELDKQVPGLTGPVVEWYDTFADGRKITLPKVVSRYAHAKPVNPAEETLFTRNT